jgi:hypothetical protein
MKKKSSINNLLSLGLGDESVNYRDQYQLKLLKKYANFAYYMKLMDSLYKDLINLDDSSLNNRPYNTSIKSLQKK